MKLHDTHPPTVPERHDGIWEMIPWYVNGSLTEGQAQDVECHAKTCPLCADEIGRQRHLAEGVIKSDPFEAPLSRSWETLRAKIEADVRARKPQKTKRNWFGERQGGVWAVLGAAAAACVVLLLQFGSSAPERDGFVTLTSGVEEAAQIVRFQPATGLTAEQLDAVMASFGVIGLAGPSETGVYTATLPKGTDTQTVADAMMARTEILFANPEMEQ